MWIKRLIFIFLCLVIAIPSRVSAQSADYPIYYVQSGDTLHAIAILFGTTTDEIIQLNNISDPNFISEGTPLLIPGLEGISGELFKTVIPLGETFNSLVNSSQLSQVDLVRINRITSPNQVFSGATLIISQSPADLVRTPFTSILEGQTLLEAAASKNSNPVNLTRQNQLLGAWDGVKGQVLYTLQSPDSETNIFNNKFVNDISITPLPLMQGKTIVITVKTTQPLSLAGTLNGHTLNFFPNGENEYVALQGIYRQAQIGITDFTLEANDAENQVFSSTLNVLMVADYFPRDNKLYVDPRLMDPAVTEPEDQRVLNLTAPATPIRQWDGYFQKPLDRTDCTSSQFGSIRSYNDSEFIYTHGGSDFVVCANNLNIYAVAPGTVVLADFLDVRGNAVIIDHGWGVYTGYWHQSQLFVKVGDHVDAGQIIGLVGTTGRSNGAHLHLEVWVGNVQVEPLDWLSTIFP
jgi:murein DD-endopeptidase MepM/ murein hydrolase activator NlpD